MQEELEVTSQTDEEALNDLCADKEGCVEEALQMKAVVSLTKHQEAVSAITQQLAETENKLQAESALCEQAHAELAKLESDLRDAQHGMISKDEHEKIMVRVESGKPYINCITKAKKCTLLSKMVCIKYLNVHHVHIFLSLDRHA